MSGISDYTIILKSPNFYIYLKEPCTAIKLLIIY